MRCRAGPGLKPSLIGWHETCAKKKRKKIMPLRPRSSFNLVGAWQCEAALRYSWGEEESGGWVTISITPCSEAFESWGTRGGISFRGSLFIKETEFRDSNTVNPSRCRSHSSQELKWISSSEPRWSCSHTFYLKKSQITPEIHFV